MKQTVCYAVAVLLHLAVLLCIPAFAPPAPVAPEEKKYLEVTLAAAPPPPAEIPPAPAPPPPPIPPPPIPPPEPPPPPVEEPPPPMEEPPPPAPEPPPLPLPPPPPEAMTLPTPAPAPVQPAPAPTPVSVPLAASAAPVSSAPISVAAPPSKYLDVIQPSFRTRVEPEYPRTALRLHEQGHVTLGLYINELGTLDKVEVVKSSGYPALDDAAAEAMKQSTFHPAYQGAIPVSSHAEITINFTPQNN
jgi:periplasmic protein TonB